MVSLKKGAVNALRLQMQTPTRLAFKESSSSEVVAMMQTAKTRHGNDLRRHWRLNGSFSASRSLIVESEMRAVLVIIADVFVYEAFQMSLVEDDHMIEQIAAAGANSAFCNTGTACMM